LWQAIGRDSINAQGQSAFWYERYTLQPASEQPEAAGEPPRSDVPIFLESVAATILTTGGAFHVLPLQCPTSVCLTYNLAYNLPHPKDSISEHI